MWSLNPAYVSVDNIMNNLSFDPLWQVLSLGVSASLRGYTLRRVNDMGSLMEKVLVCDAGLDDVVLEMCKYVTKLEMAQTTIGVEQKDEFMASVLA